MVSPSLGLRRWQTGGLMAKSNSSRNALGAGAAPAANRVVRCAIYTRKSTEEGLQQEFNSLDAQREAAEAYVSSQTDLPPGTEHYSGR